MNANKISPVKLLVMAFFVFAASFTACATVALIHRYDVQHATTVQSHQPLPQDAPCWHILTKACDV